MHTHVHRLEQKSKHMLEDPLQIFNGLFIGSGGDGPDTTLQYKYGFPLVDPLYIVAYFEAGYDLTLETCKLLVEGGQLREQNCQCNYDYAQHDDNKLVPIHRFIRICGILLRRLC